MYVTASPTISVHIWTLTLMFGNKSSWKFTQYFFTDIIVNILLNFNKPHKF